MRIEKTRSIFITGTLLLLVVGCASVESKSNKVETTNVKSKTESDNNYNAQMAEYLDSLDKANNELVRSAGEYITKAYVDSDNIVHLISSMKADHRFFGYAQPDTASERLLLLSVFTNDVKDNPFQCKLGAFYETLGMGELVLRFIGVEGDFAKVLATDNSTINTPLYIESRWIEM
ncbi:MAG: hypothetical protein AB8B72_13570 [Crocinitomicaceae bacterium]